MIGQNTTVVFDKNDGKPFNHKTLKFDLLSSPDSRIFKFIADGALAIQNERSGVECEFGPDRTYEWINVQFKGAIVGKFGLAPQRGFSTLKRILMSYMPYLVSSDSNGSGPVELRVLHS